MKAESAKLDELRAEGVEVFALEGVAWAAYDDAFRLHAQLHDLALALERASDFLLDDTHKTWHAEEAVLAAREALKEVGQALGERRAALWAEEKDETRRVERGSAS